MAASTSLPPSRPIALAVRAALWALSNGRGEKSARGHAHSPIFAVSMMSLFAARRRANAMGGASTEPRAGKRWFPKVADDAWKLPNGLEKKVMSSALVVDLAKVRENVQRKLLLARRGPATGDRISRRPRCRACGPSS